MTWTIFIRQVGYNEIIKEEIMDYILWQYILLFALTFIASVLFMIPIFLHIQMYNRMGKEIKHIQNRKG
jgi:hypothetical protein